MAVLRPTPGSLTSSSIVCGISPPCRSTTAADMPRRLFVLLRKNPVLLNEPLQLRPDLPRRAILHRGKLEKRGRDNVHPLVGALRAQDGGDQKLERGFEIELAVRIRILLFQAWRISRECSFSAAPRSFLRFTGFVSFTFAIPSSSLMQTEAPPMRSLR